MCNPVQVGGGIVRVVFMYMYIVKMKKALPCFPWLFMFSSVDLHRELMYFFQAMEGFDSSEEV